MSGGSLQPGKALELHAGRVWSSSRQDGFHAYASPEAGSDFKHFFKDLLLGQTVHAEYKGCRSPFGRGNGVACLGETCGLCGKRTLPPLGIGSQVKRFTQISADNRRGFQRIGVIKGAVALGGLVVVYKRLDPGSSKLARDDTVYSLADLFRGLLFSISPSNILLILSILLSAFYNLFHHSTFSLS